MIWIMLRKLPKLPSPFDYLAVSQKNVVKVGSGDFLFHQGTPAHAMFYLLEGKVRLVRHTENGQKVTLFRAISGDLLAEASLFASDYHCDCTADQDSILVRLSKAACQKALAENLEFSIQYIERLSKQVQFYRRRIELMSIKPAKERVWAACCDGWLVDNISEFAATVDLTPEATYRALASLVTDGRIAKSGYGQYAVK